MRCTIILAIVALATSTTTLANPGSDRMASRIDRLLERTPLIDGHNDLPWAFRNAYLADPASIDIARPNRYDTDLPRLREGHVGAQFWSIYIPAMVGEDVSTRMALEQIDLVRAMCSRHPDLLAMAVDAEGILSAHRQGRIACLLGLEGGHHIAGSMAVLRSFYALGVRYMTLTHATNTAWADSGTDEPVHNGLTPLGRSIVEEMNRIGMLVDLSHTSPDTMRQALEITRAPVIFSHSNARAQVDHPRNIPDDVLVSLRKNGGVAMVSFIPELTSRDRFEWGEALAAEENRLSGQSQETIDAALKVWSVAHPQPHATIAQVADHIEHIRRVAGVDHVGIGSDFDGVVELPDGLKGVEDFPNLFYELARRGWTDQDLAKLAGMNMIRAMRAAAAVVEPRVRPEPCPFQALHGSIAPNTIDVAGDAVALRPRSQLCVAPN